MNDVDDEPERNDWATPHVKKAVRVEAWVTGIVIVVILVGLLFGVVAR
ncbi:hypothetical protein [Ilumatobacter nonamiensis]|nr:hypothetical protein [Ilumatobacter nonamiensis]